MRLSKFTDYAFRVLILAASRDGTSTIEEAATAFAVSRAHLKKVVRTLTAAGLLKGVRGRGGGFRLGRPADEIRLDEVVRLTETDFALVECFLPGTTCPIAGPCKLVPVLVEARTAFLAPFARKTLADISLPAVRFGDLPEEGVASGEPPGEPSS